MIKKDCFAIKGSKCMALNRLYCQTSKCGFYKTRVQYQEDMIKSHEKLRSLPTFELQCIADKYEVMAKVLSL